LVLAEIMAHGVDGKGRKCGGRGHVRTYGQLSLAI
jgi:hypothetical protein